MKTAFLCFFPVIPTNMGSAEVIRSFFLCWPGKKKLFQITHLKDEDRAFTRSFRIFKEKPILKLLVIPFLLISVLRYLKSSKNKIVIIEGPSWIGYSFISLIIIKTFSPNTKIIYHSHSIEYEVRKMTSSNIIIFITKILERMVYKYSDIATSVSNIEKKKLKKLYNVHTINLNNGISKRRIKFSKKKILDFDYIIYCGSYKYLPNKFAIDFLVNKVMPKLIKYNPKLKLVLTGGGYNKTKKKFLKNFGIVRKYNLLNLIYNSKAMAVPLDKGTGTRIKIIEALSVGGKVLSTPKGAEGIILHNKINSNLIIARKVDFIKKLKKLINSYSKFKKLKSFHEDYLMENIVSKFLNQKNVKNIIKKN